MKEVVVLSGQGGKGKTTLVGPLVHARLGMGHENRGKLVELVRQKAKAVAQNEKFDYIISDGARGIGSHT